MYNQLTSYNPTQQLQSSSLAPDQQAHINSLLQKSKASNTVDAYQSDWKQFIEFCTLHNQSPLPTQTESLLLYISELSKTHKLSSIKRKLSSINKANQTAGFPPPTYNSIIKDMIDGVARKIGNKQQPKKAITLDILKAIIDCIDVSTLAGMRDKALILTGFSTASRRSELVSLDVSDITFTSKGMDIQIRIEKTQEYVTKSVLYAYNDYCAVDALKQWLYASQIIYKAAFRSINKVGKIGERLNDESVSNTIKKYAKLAGLDSSLFAGHSLRSGLATSAAEEGMSDSAIMKQTAHNTRAVLDRYIQTGNRYKNNASEILKKL